MVRIDRARANECAQQQQDRRALPCRARAQVQPLLDRPAAALVAKRETHAIGRAVVGVDGAQRAERALVEALAVSPAREPPLGQATFEVDHEHGVLAHAEALHGLHGVHVDGVELALFELLRREEALSENATDAEDIVVHLTARRV